MHLHIWRAFPQILLTVKRWDVGVLVSSGCSDKNTTDWGLRQQRRSCLTAPEAGSPTLSHWQIDQPEGKKSNQVFVLLVVTSIGMWEEKEGRGRDTDRESRSQCTGGGAHKSPRIRCIKFVHF